MLPCSLPHLRAWHKAWGNLRLLVAPAPRHPKETAHCEEGKVSPRPPGRSCLCLCGPSHDTCRRQTKQRSPCPWFGDKEERGPATAPAPGPLGMNSSMGRPATQQVLSTSASPSWKETLVWSLAKPIAPWVCNCEHVGPGHGTMRSSSLGR